MQFISVYSFIYLFIFDRFGPDRFTKAPFRSYEQLQNMNECMAVTAKFSSDWKYTKWAVSRVLKRSVKCTNQLQALGAVLRKGMIYVEQGPFEAWERVNGILRNVEEYSRAVFPFALFLNYTLVQASYLHKKNRVLSSLDVVWPQCLERRGFQAPHSGHEKTEAVQGVFQKSIRAFPLISRTTHPGLAGIFWVMMEPVVYSELFSWGIERKLATHWSAGTYCCLAQWWIFLFWAAIWGNRGKHC